MLRFLPLIFSIALFIACNSTQKEAKQQEESSEQKAKIYRANVKNTADIEVFDQYARSVATGKATLMDGNILAVPLHLVQGNYSVKCKFLGKSIQPMAGGYYQYSFKANLLLLNITGGKQDFVAPATTFSGAPYYALTLEEGKIRVVNLETGTPFTQDSVQFVPTTRALPAGTSVFNSNHALVGMFNTVKVQGHDSIVILPIQEIKRLLPAQKVAPKSISNLRLKTDKVYPKAEKVKGFTVHTTSGNFTFKIYEDLPEYKDNMIKLASDGYYDSLLVHRVIHNFLIQTGAADTKYAKKGDPVGWQGPGYMLPTIIKNKYIHKRSAVAMSKPPAYKNPDNRTSGSQFYIITGRTFSDEELNDYETLKKFKYTTAQRNLYKTVGGAAYLDNDYAVIGEVTTGMQVVDKIAGAPIDEDERPLADIRILSIELLY